MVRLSQNSFFGGQLDFEMMGRQDYQRYSKGATKLRNFNIVKRGGLDKRHGFDRLLKLTGSSDARLSGVTESSVIRMIPFAYSKTQGFVLVLMSTPSNGSSKAIVLSTNPVNKFKWYTVSNLNGVYSQSELNEIDYQQCGDTMFLAHQNHPPPKVEHYIDPSNGEHGFQYEVLDFGDRSRGPSTRLTRHSTTRLRCSPRSTRSLPSTMESRHYPAPSITARTAIRMVLVLGTALTIRCLGLRARR